MSMDKVFTINNKTYRADAETVTVIKSLAPSAKAANDASAVAAVMALGLATGRIVRA